MQVPVQRQDVLEDLAHHQRQPTSDAHGHRTDRHPRSAGGPWPVRRRSASRARAAERRYAIRRGPWRGRPFRSQGAGGSGGRAGTECSRSTCDATSGNLPGSISQIATGSPARRAPAPRGVPQDRLDDRRLHYPFRATWVGGFVQRPDAAAAMTAPLPRVRRRSPPARRSRATLGRMGTSWTAPASGSLAGATVTVVADDMCMTPRTPRGRANAGRPGNEGSRSTSSWACCASCLGVQPGLDRNHRRCRPGCVTPIGDQ